MLNYRQVGKGPNKVIVMHDWFSDSTSYDTVLPYLETEPYTFVFVDLRGYGGSKKIEGEYTALEASDDVRAVANTLGFQRYAVIGHSMCGMVAQHMAMREPEKIVGVFAITPVPASGSPADEGQVEFMQNAVREGNEAAYQAVDFMSGNRHSAKFIQKKVAHWHACSTEEARLQYMHMFSFTDFSKEVKGLKTPFRVLCGQHDAPIYQMEALEKSFGAWYPNAELVLCENSGHYPMQETPVFLATQINQFLEKIF